MTEATHTNGFHRHGPQPRLFGNCFHLNPEKPMNKDHVQGKAKEIAGKIQKAAGELVDSPKQQAKGAAKEVAGKAQQKRGDVKDALSR